MYFVNLVCLFETTTSNSIIRKDFFQINDLHCTKHFGSARLYQIAFFNQFLKSLNWIVDTQIVSNGSWKIIWPLGGRLWRI